LLETTSTNGQNNQGTTTTNGFLDSSSSPFTITRNGSPTQGSVTPYWPNGQWSNLFNGSTDYLRSTNATTVFQFGSNPYTFEGWIYQTARSGNHYVCGGVFSGTSYQVIINSSGFIFGSVTGVGNLTAATTAIPLNTWTHFAIVRTNTSSGGVAYYINGAAAGTATDSSNISGTTTTLNVGTTNNDGSVGLNGYLSNLRVVNGRAVYTGVFTPPTVPLTATTGGTNPPTGTQCTLLTCQSNRFRDNSAQVTPATFTTTGTPRAQAFQPFSPSAAYTPAAYGGSGYFNGSDAYLTYNQTFALGTNNFTLEFWLNIPVDVVFPTNYWLWGNRNGTDNCPALYLAGVSGGGNTLVFVGASLTNPNSIPANSWTHVAIVRSGLGANNLKMYINGVQVAQSSSTQSFSYTGSQPVGANSSGDGPLYPSNVYFSNFRIVNGAAVYTGNFTPPTLAPLTTAGSTSAASYTDTTNVNTSFAASSTPLLLNFTNAGIYDATTQNVVSTVGDAQVSTAITAKWPPTSIRFDGTGDYLNVSAGSPQSLTFGTGDFTIEFWVYFTSNTGQQVLYDGRSANGAYPLLYTNAGVLTYFVNTSAVITSVQPSTGVWYFMSLRRSSGTTQFFINGTQSGGSYTDSTNYLAPPTSGGRVGANFTGGDFLFGYIQDFRVTKGVARAATPIPTAPFPVQ
jgi:hypothetical protein